MLSPEKALFVFGLVLVLSAAEISLKDETNLNFHNPQSLVQWKEKIDTDIGNKLIRDAVIPSYVRNFLNNFQDGEGNQNFTTRLLVGVESDHCKGHVLEWIERLKSFRWLTENDKWAAHMIDSWGKLPEGILTGHVSAFGDFDECVMVKAINITLLNTEFSDISTSFDGQYCTVNIFDYESAMTAAGRSVEDENSQTPNYFHSNNSDKIEIMDTPGVIELINLILTQKVSTVMLLPSIATCMPNSCSQKDVQNILVNAIDMSLYANFSEGDKATLPWPVTGYCADRHNRDFDAIVIIAIIILSTLLILCVGAGLVDYFLTDEKDPVEHGIVYKYLMAFSFYSNTKKWLSTKRGSEDFGCLHGIRFLSMAYIILGHSYSIAAYAPLWNILDFKNIWKDWTTLAIINGTFSVDTFFVMSGMLACYSILKMLDKTKGKFNIPMFYFHRIVRITPTYAILVLISTTLTTFVGNGPMWFVMTDHEDRCRKNWWINLLYINNLHKSDEPCNGETWYLANDMQFYILSPFIVYPIWRWRRIGLGLLSVYTVFSTISPILVTHLEDTMPAAIRTREGPVFANFNDVYIRPWVRIQTFLVGVWLGWTLHFTRNKRFRLSPLVVVCGWVASAGLALVVLFGIYPWFNPENEIPKASGLIYAGCSRLAFAVSICWVIFACLKGYGGLVNSFLSWKVFMPLGRLAFCVYLIGPNLQSIFHFGLKIPIKYSTYTIVNFFFSHLVISCMVGFVATILFEAPFIALQKLIFVKN